MNLALEPSRLAESPVCGKALRQQSARDERARGAFRRSAGFYLALRSPEGLSTYCKSPSRTEWLSSVSEVRLGRVTAWSGSRRPAVLGPPT